MICHDGCIYWDDDTCSKHYEPEDEDNCVYYMDIYKAHSIYWRKNYWKIG